MLKNALHGFIAGFIATLVFHQGTVWLLHFGPGFPFPAWRLTHNGFGVPAVVSLAFWAGLWGVLLACLLAAAPRLPQLRSGFVLGALLPSLLGWTFIATLRGAPLFAGGNLRTILLVLLVNGVWGWGTVLLWQQLQGRPAR